MFNKAKFLSALLGAVYFFLVLTAYYMLKPLRDSSFLDVFPPTYKPLFNLVTLSVLFFAASLYTLFVKKFQGNRFVISFYVFIAVNLILFRLAFDFSPKIVGGVFYVWLSCANVFLVTVFWTQINGTLTTSTDKLYYALIGLGGSAGAAFGGKLTSLIVPLIGSNNLIYSALGFLCLAFLCSFTISNQTGVEGFNIIEKEKIKANFRGLLGDKYARAILIIVAVGTFVQTIYDYQLTSLVSQTITGGKDAYSIFYGGLYYKLNIYSFAATSILGTIILSTVGAARGLLLMPVFLIGSFFVLKNDSSLGAMEWVFIVVAGSGYSIFQLFKEQLYIPAASVIKVSNKGFIDTFGYRLGDAMAAISSMIMVSLFGFQWFSLAYLVLIAAALVLWQIIQAGSIYEKLTEKQEPPIRVILRWIRSFGQTKKN